MAATEDSRLEALEAQVTTLAVLLEGKEASLEAAEQAVVAANARTFDLEELVAALGQASDAAAAHCELSKKELAEVRGSQGELDNARLRLRDLEAALQSEKAARATAESQLHELETRSPELERQLSEAEVTRSAALWRVADLELANGELELQVAKLSRSTAELKENATTQSDAVHGRLDRLQETLSSRLRDAERAAEADARRRLEVRDMGTQTASKGPFAADATTRPETPRKPAAGPARAEVNRGCSRTGLWSSVGPRPSWESQRPASSVSVPSLTRKASKDGAGRSPLWEIDGDFGWKLWVPGVPYCGEAGETVEFTVGRQQYKANFDAAYAGVQINVTSGKRRALRRVEPAAGGA